MAFSFGIQLKDKRELTTNGRHSTVIAALCSHKSTAAS